MSVVIAIPVLTGLLGGWIINYLSDVLPMTRRLSQPTCRECQVTLSLHDYLLFRDCPSCAARRRTRSWIVQVAGVAVSLLLWFNPHPKLGFFGGSILLLYFAVVFVIDLEHRLIMHPVSIFGVALGLGVGSFIHGIIPALLGGLGGFAIMLAFYWFGTLFARIRARRMQAAGEPIDDEEALGAGDVILATFLGLMLGWPMIWFGLLLGILLGGIITLPMLIGMLVIRRYKQNAWMVFIPYGPFFIISATLILYFPNLLSVLVPK